MQSRTPYDRPGWGGLAPSKGRVDGTMAASDVHRLQADLFRALAHPLRIQILELLAGTERGVGELLGLTGAEASHLSQQLGVLRGAGVLVSRREGSNVYYRIRDPRTLHLLATGREILATSLSETRELLDELRPADTVAEPRGSTVQDRR